MSGFAGRIAVVGFVFCGCFPPALGQLEDVEAEEGEVEDSTETPKDIVEADGDGTSQDVPTEVEVADLREETEAEVADILEDSEVLEPRCEPACANDGRCVQGDVCDCEGTGYGGPTCRELSCVDVVCPALTGYTATCSLARHCEYARTSLTEAWHEDDVWIFVPPGSFPMGEPETPFPLGSRDSERPVRTVSFDEGFLIQKFEVTVRTYEACEALGACSPPSVVDDDPSTWGLNRSTNGRARHPQNGVNWDQAGAVCGWLGGRRPSEAEWEYAANGPDSHRMRPWGDGGVSCDHAVIGVLNTVLNQVNYGCDAGGTWGVGQKPAGASPVGALDMIGNVSEWVDDCFHDTYEGGPTDGRAWNAECSVPERVVRGGSYAVPTLTAIVSDYRVAARTHSQPSVRAAVRGVRCVSPVR